jgi:hypothetical protein
MSSPDPSKKKKAVSSTEAPPAASPFSSHQDPVGAAAQMAAAGLKALASWRLVEAKSEDAASEPDPLWSNLKNLLTWRAPEARKKVVKGSAGYEPEPNYKVDLLMTALIPKVDRRNIKR